MYYNFRYFSSELGRWLSRDPIGEEGGLNLFCILRNSTISLYDYWGLVCYCGKDITEALNKHLSDIEKLFNEGKFTDSMNHGMQWGFLGLGTDGWDFAVLYDNSIGKTSELVSKHGKNKTCAQTVSVAGHCYRIAEVNYLLWGKLMQLRNRKYNKIYEDGTFGLIRVYRSFFGIISKIQTGEAIQGGTDGRLFWATVGLNSQRSLPENIDDIHYQYPDTAIFVPYQYPDTGFFVPSDMYGFIGYGSYITLPGRVITAKDVSKSECVVDESDVFNGSLEPWIHDKNTPGGYFRL